MAQCTHPAANPNAKPHSKVEARYEADKCTNDSESRPVSSSEECSHIREGYSRIKSNESNSVRLVKHYDGKFVAFEDNALRLEVSCIRRSRDARDLVHEKKCLAAGNATVQLPLRMPNLSHLRMLSCSHNTSPLSAVLSISTNSLNAPHLSSYAGGANDSAIATMRCSPQGRGRRTGYTARIRRLMTLRRLIWHGAQRQQ